MRASFAHERTSAYFPGFGSMVNSVLFQISLPALVKYTSRSIDSHMVTWKLIETVSGNMEAVSGPAAQDRPGTHECIVWEGHAADKAEALKCAEKADPGVMPIGIAQRFSFGAFAIMTPLSPPDDRASTISVWTQPK
jgi:hypothetical protein